MRDPLHGQMLISEDEQRLLTLSPNLPWKSSMTQTESQVVHMPSPRFSFQLQAAPGTT
jgi:hypothetical protein